MHATRRSVFVFILALLGAVALGAAATLTSAAALAVTKSLIMGGTGRPDPDDFPGYVENVTDYYIHPNSSCDSDSCEPIAVTTPETAWPLYGGLSALTWKDSILAGVEDFDGALRTELNDQDCANDPACRVVLFGYSQSGAILAIELQNIADDPTIDKSKLEVVVIGNVSRPNGGLNGRTGGKGIPIVEFPFGPTVPTDTGIPMTDVAMKWDIIADAPLYATNPLAMFNALLGFWYVHGTYPDPTLASPDSTPGGYDPEQWQDMMENPEDYPEIIDIEVVGNNTYLTVTPTVLPVVQPLHDLGLTPLADLMEPALREIIEQTGYDRSISYSQPTHFRLIPIFNPIELTLDVAAAIPEGIEQALAGLGATSVNAPATPSTLARTPNSSTLSAFDTGDPPATTTPAPESDGSVATQGSGMETEPATADPAPTNNGEAREAEADNSPTSTAPKPKRPKIPSQIRSSLRGIADLTESVLAPKRKKPSTAATTPQTGSADADGAGAASSTDGNPATGGGSANGAAGEAA